MPNARCPNTYGLSLLGQLVPFPVLRRTTWTLVSWPDNPANADIGRDPTKPHLSKILVGQLL